MLFKDIQKGSAVFVLDKQEFSTTEGKVLSVIPRMDIDKQTGRSMMVVDVELDIEGKVDTFTIPEGLAITYARNLVLSTDRVGLVNEVNSICDRARKIIEAAPVQQRILDKAPEVLAILDPQVKERQRIDERFRVLEKSQEVTANDVAEIKSDLKELLKKLS